MKIKKIVAVLGVVSLVISLAVISSAPLAWAQEPGDGGRPRDNALPSSGHSGEEEKGREIVSQDNVGGAGLADPPPSGMSVLYTFTGARYKAGVAATSVHCTNYGTESATVRVEIYDWDNDPYATFSGQYSIPRNRTATFSTGDTALYSEDVVMSQTTSEEINQGSGRVMSNKRTLICTAQVLDPAHAQPWFAVKLALYYPDGTPVSAYYLASLYLPVILRQ